MIQPNFTIDKQVPGLSGFKSQMYPYAEPMNTPHLEWI